jgi:ATP-binding cassette subfamily B protein
MGLLHRLPISFFDRQPVGRLTTRVTNDIDTINEVFAAGILGAMGDLLRLFGITAVMLYVDVRLGLAAFAALPVVILLVFVLRRPMRESFRAIRGRNARLNSALSEQISGIAVVQAFDQMPRVEREFDRINRDFREANLSAIRYEAIQDGALETIASVAFAAIVLAYCGSSSSYGTLLAFQLYLAQFFEPLSQLSQRYTLLQSAMAGAERVFGLLDEPGRDAPMAKALSKAEAGRVEPPPSTSRRDPEIPLEHLAEGGSNAASGVAILPTLAQGPALIAFSKVDFAYRSGNRVLSNVSFDVRRGEHVALVGPTGSGKSTVISLLLRLYEMERGRITLDGQSVLEIEAAELRARFAYVPQDPVLFPGTLLSNIAGKEALDIDRARDVLTQMDALVHFEKRLGGLDCTLQAGGQLLSVGERQLVAFARALYRGSEILLLDEATASVDSDTERRLQRALEVSLDKRTAIVVAHRLGTIKSADRVLVLNHGRLMQQGSHRELLQQGGLYRRLVQLSQVRSGSAPID